MYSVIAFSSLIVTAFSVFFAIRGKHYFYWIAAIGIYVFSFLAGFSIGQLTVGFTFIPLMLAIGYSFGWIKNKIHSIVFLVIGLIIGSLAVLYVDDAWLFFPFWIVSSLLD